MNTHTRTHGAHVTCTPRQANMHACTHACAEHDPHSFYIQHLILNNIRISCTIDWVSYRLTSLMTTPPLPPPRPPLCSRYRCRAFIDVVLVLAIIIIIIDVGATNMRMHPHESRTHARTVHMLHAHHVKQTCAHAHTHAQNMTHAPLSLYIHDRIVGHRLV